MELWQQLGAKGWTFASMMRAIDKSQLTVNKVGQKWKSSFDEAWIESCQNAFNLPRCDDWPEPIFPRYSTAMSDDQV